MGTDLADTLEKILELRNQIDYWFQCLGEDKDKMLTDLLDQVEARCREANEWPKS